MKKRNLKFIAGLLGTFFLSACGQLTPASSDASSISSENPLSSEASQIESSTSDPASTIEESSESEITSSEEPSSESSSELTSESTSSSSSSSSSKPSSSSQPSSSSSSQPSSSSSSSSSSSRPSSSISDTYWNVDASDYGEDFRAALKTQIDAYRKSWPGYKACLSIGAKAAAYPNKSSSTFVPFYHGTDTLATTSECNREHCWPKSRGSGSTNVENDPFVVRPTLTSDNSARGNNFYGIGTSQWDPASCGFEAARGESARIILYAATAYYNLGLNLTNNPGDSTAMKSMGKLSTLLEWNTEYPVTDMEIQINEYLYEQGYGRNPFVDHPEYADYIWDESGLRKSEYEGGENSSNSGTHSSSTKVEAYDYTLITDADDLDGARVAIVSTDITYSNCVAMTTTPKSSSTPWYLSEVDARVSADKSSMSCDSSSLATFELERQTDGSFTLYSGEADKYLGAYIDGTHYSIEMTQNSQYSTSSLDWDIEMEQDGSCVLKNKTGVYLEAYKGSWCGYSKAPANSIYLYR